MAITFNYDGKPAFMFQAGATSTDGIWYALGAKIDTASGYEWGGVHTFLNDVIFDDTVVARDGWNNFLNPAARDAALTSPVQGTICFVRQDAGGNPLNQIQFYNGSAWVANDGDINGITAGTGLTGGGTAGTISLAVDTTVVATTNNTLTMTGKTLTSATLTTPTLTLSTTSAVTEGQIAWNSTNDKIIVGDGTTAREFASSTLVTNAQVGTTYTLALTDKDKLVELNNGSAISLTVPANTSAAFPTGSQINIIQTGAGQVTIAGTSGVTVNGTPGLKLRAQWSSATLIKRGTDTWVAVGDLSA